MYSILWSNALFSQHSYVFCIVYLMRNVHVFIQVDDDFSRTPNKMKQTQIDHSRGWQ